jgi:hypothetical protein
MSERTSPPYFTRADQENLRDGYYWIKRCEPDGPPYWEVARFSNDLWQIAGSPYSVLPTIYVNASNAWQLGPRVEEPSA